MAPSLTMERSFRLSTRSVCSAQSSQKYGFALRAFTGALTGATMSLRRRIRLGCPTASSLNWPVQQTQSQDKQFRYRGCLVVLVRALCRLAATRTAGLPWSAARNWLLLCFWLLATEAARAVCYPTPLASGSLAPGMFLSRCNPSTSSCLQLLGCADRLAVWCDEHSDETHVANACRGADLAAIWVVPHTMWF